MSKKKTFYGLFLQEPLKIRILKINGFVFKCKSSLNAAFTPNRGLLISTIHAL